MIEVGAVNQLARRLRKPNLYHFRRHMVAPKKRTTEFKVSPDALIPSGTSDVRIGRYTFRSSRFIVFFRCQFDSSSFRPWTICGLPS
jgi:hypothetical protein